MRFPGQIDQLTQEEYEAIPFREEVRNPVVGQSYRTVDKHKNTLVYYVSERPAFWHAYLVVIK